MYINLGNNDKIIYLYQLVMAGFLEPSTVVTFGHVWSVKRSRQITCTGKTKELTKPHSEECEGEALAARTFQRKVGYPFGKVCLIHGDTRGWHIFCKELDWKITT